jgi:hypothetical protein
MPARYGLTGLTANTAQEELVAAAGLRGEDSTPDRVVTYVQSNEYDAYFEATGRREAFVAKVGTRHRGRARPASSCGTRWSATATPGTARRRSTSTPRTRRARSGSTSGPALRSRAAGPTTSCCGSR